MSHSTASLFGSIILGCCLMGLGASEVNAQSRRHQVSAYGQSAPVQGKRKPPRSPQSSNPIGTDLPSASRPASPPPSYGQSQGDPSARGERAQTNGKPGPPSDPTQVPLGGTEWLAAAGAGYALSRLRKESLDDAGEKT